MQIGELKIDTPVILAPMAGVTDYPYRQIIRQMGCQLVYTEMVSSQGIIYKNQRTEELIDFPEGETGLIAVQLFGKDPESMAEAASIVTEKYRPDIIDINMGCPTPKIVKNGSGVALMKKPDLVGQIISAVVDSVGIPVTVKIRKGWDDEHINAVEIACIAEKNGAKAVAVHGRTREEFYSGKADWDIIKEVKKRLTIPVIGNGDVFSPELAKKMIDLTDCDGVMIARGAKGNPWLVKRSIQYLNKGEITAEPEYDEIIEMAIFHLEKAVKYYGEEIALPRMRKHLTWYLKGIPYSAPVKDKINKLTDRSKIKLVLNNFLFDLKSRAYSE